MSTRTNPAYKAIVYRRTIIHSVIISLKRDYLGVDSDPEKKMICEEVFSADSEIPTEEILGFVEELEREHHGLTLEMNKFEFTKKNDHDQKFQPAAKKGNQVRR